MDDTPTPILVLQILARICARGALILAGGARSIWSAAAKFEARLERRFDRFIDTGWRRAFGWMGLAVAGFSYLYAPVHGLVVNYDAVNVFLAFSTGMYVVRGAEKHLRDRLGLPAGPMGPGAASELAAGL